jgi:acyl carrier protein
LIIAGLTIQEPLRMQELDPKVITDIRSTVYSFFSEECDVPTENLSDETNIITDLEGDSLMLLSLLEIFRKKYKLTIELKSLGKHLMKKPANTIGQVIDLTKNIVLHGDKILSVEL